METKLRFRSPRWAYAGGGLAVVVVLGVKFLIGGIYGAQAALDLISALQATSLYFGAATATASATIMALMLTLLGFARRGDTEFDDWVFRSINRISTVAAFTLGGSILLLMMLQLPVGEFEKIPHGWYSTLYYILVMLISLLAGLMISTVLMLLSTVRYVISHLTPGDEV